MITEKNRTLIKYFVIMIIAVLMLSDSVAMADVGTKAKKEPAPSFDVPFACAKNVSFENTGKGIQISWEKVPGADDYHILCRKTGGKRWNDLKKTTHVNMLTWHDKTKKKNGEKYEYCIAACRTHKAVQKVRVSVAVKKMNIQIYSTYRLKPVKFTSFSRSAGKKAVAGWKKSSIPGNCSYIVQFSKNPFFLKKSTVKAENKNRTSAVFVSKAVSSRECCRLRVRTKADGKWYYSSWSYSPNMKSAMKMKTRYFAKKAKKKDYRKEGKLKLYQYDTFQGSCVVGNKVYHAVNDRVKKRIKIMITTAGTGKVVTLSRNSAPGHGNSMTYNKDDGVIVYTNHQKKSDILHVLDARTLKYKRTVQFRKPSSLAGTSKKNLKKVKGLTAISYCHARKKYIGRVTGKNGYIVLNRNFVPERYINVKKIAKELNQTMICTKDLIMNVKSPVKQAYNLVVMYDWSGAHVGTIRMNKYNELESIYGYKGNMYGDVYSSYFKTVTNTIKTKTKKGKLKKVIQKKKVWTRDNYIFKVI